MDHAAFEGHDLKRNQRLPYKEVKLQLLADLERKQAILMQKERAKGARNRLFVETLSAIIQDDEAYSGVLGPIVSSLM